MSSNTRASRARLAALTRHRPAGDPEVLQAEREHHLLSLEEHAQRVADQFGPIPDDVADHVAAILRGAK
jgi:hypothetical protein